METIRMGFLGQQGARWQALGEEDDLIRDSEIRSANTSVGIIGIGLSYTTSMISPSSSALTT
jgi:hypothetical protein